MSRLPELTAALMPHLMLAPIALPMLTAALLLLLREERQRRREFRDAAVEPRAVLTVNVEHVFGGDGHGVISRHGS